MIYNFIISAQITSSVNIMVVYLYPGQSFEHKI